VILAGVFIARMVVARVAQNTIDPVGIVTDNGRKVMVTGPMSALGCLDCSLCYGSPPFKPPLAKARLLHIKANSGKLACR
jgi:hypothetical protein